ncbi:MoxR-like ATPase [Allocatelliglobosispora scoriae]|uniref:MoxR-like ATPase n=1 Tax=Allocatelliglobosispora scoriae TaxID=643052 RepID=A0A841BIM9_9ACTN|nr:MoxR family ATPase [Allocatelliglobosispora scoriae]MBB5866670.1 MoxR-like ATPase [Allocatelliglobosispora scoriae]
MTDLNLYTGTSEPHSVTLPPAPPWRRFAGAAMAHPAEITEDPVAGAEFNADQPTVEAVNAALVLRRPLLLTGRPGSGKSSLIYSVARELRLGPVLRWHVTSRSTLQDALYRYDAIGRLHAHNLEGRTPKLTEYLRLGPLGTALLPSRRPRALLVDEIDKGDIDLPNDLLDVFERGEFHIPELTRLAADREEVRVDDSDDVVEIERGRVLCAEFPLVVLTSNGERDFPPAFLRRCIRHRMPDPEDQDLAAIVARHLGKSHADAAATLIADFAERAAKSKALATDQLLNAVHLVTGQFPVDSPERRRLVDLLFKQLTSDHP